MSVECFLALINGKSVSDVEQIVKPSYVVLSNEHEEISHEQEFFFFISISLKCSTLYSFSCRELRASHTAVFFYVQILCTSFFVCLFLSYFHTQNSVVGLFWNQFDFSEILSRE